MKSILDRSFVYTPSKDHQGDPTYLLRKFKKIRAEQAKNRAEAVEKVQPITRKTKGT